MEIAMINKSLILAACMMASVPAFSQTPRLDLLGNPAPPNAATRTIVLSPDSRWINVKGGEIVSFVVGDQTFAWHFYVGTAISSFDLNLVAPPGMLHQRVQAYVSMDTGHRY
jgi:hypothetical protein